MNTLLILSTPTTGAHYFVDVGAGVAVAALSIAMSGWILGQHAAIHRPHIESAGAVDIRSEASIR